MNKIVLELEKQVRMTHVFQLYTMALLIANLTLSALAVGTYKGTVADKIFSVGAPLGMLLAAIVVFAYVMKDELKDRWGIKR
jgi:hypothetical protein